jgi:uncharacterized protein YgiB involved in biofilm formation
MKRSSVITLLVLGSGGVFLYALAGEKRADSVPDGGKTYVTQDQCETAGDLPKEDCAKSWDEALKHHETTAPKFTSITDCEKEYGEGKCTVPRAGGSGSFFPVMAAFMIGRAWGSQGYAAAPLVRRPQDPQGQYGFTGGKYAGGPSSSGLWGGGNSSSRGSGGGWWGRPSSSSSGAATSTTSRGGFGSSGGHYSSGG